MRKRFLNLTLAMGLVAGLFVGALGTASAETPVGGQQEMIFFPWVPNGEVLGDGFGPFYGTVTIQNLEAGRINVEFGSTAGGDIGNGFRMSLEPFASRTISADQLGIEAPGAGVVARSSWHLNPGETVPEACAEPRAVTSEIERGEGDVDTLPVASVVSVENVFDDNNDYLAGVDYIVDNDQIIWQGAGIRPVEGEDYTVEYTILECERGPEIGGVVKQVAAEPFAANARTTSDHIAVDGYTAIPDEDVAWGPASAFCADQAQGLYSCNNAGFYFNGLPLGGFDGHSYLPIVQTNNGWGSTIHITNVDASAGDFTSVTVALYAADGQGTGGAPVTTETFTVSRGESISVDISDLPGIGDEWVGSAWITSDYAVVANVSRYKAETNMLLTNTGAPSLWATTSQDGGTVAPIGPGGPGVGGVNYEMYAPIVFQRYNGWNTGISVANIAEVQNTVNVQFLNANGSTVGSASLTVPARGMEYIYVPNTGDVGLDDFVGSAILSSNLPFHASVDEVKYETGEAMSYIATAAGASLSLFETAPEGSFPKLSFPLVQNGVNGSGDISGIQLFNPNRSFGVTVGVEWLYQSGAAATPSENTLYTLTLGALNNATLYSIDVGNPPNFVGSAVVAPVDGLGAVVGVSNNVNYDVDGDGSAVYNGLNTWGQFRLFSSQQGPGDLEPPTPPDGI